MSMTPPRTGSEIGRVPTQGCACAGRPYSHATPAMQEEAAALIAGLVFAGK